MKIKLYNDIVFKWIFGRQNHTAPLINLINSVICHDDDSTAKFSQVEILNPFDSSKPFKNEKQGILDIRAKETESNEWVNIEVQVISSTSYPQRSKFYLAGMYREQLKKSSKKNYHDLKAVYGIHILVETLFENKEDEKFWFNHYTMLNTRSYKPLAGHWHLYYVELEKFLACFGEKSKTDNALEQWSYFLGRVQDNTKSLDKIVRKNEIIKEIHEMLKTFTKNDRLREQYRLYEEFLRAQRTERAEFKWLNQKYIKEQRAAKAALKAQQAAVKAQETERIEKEEAVKDRKSVV